jgi:hypothetical protein
VQESRINDHCVVLIWIHNPSKVQIRINIVAIFHIKMPVVW